MIHKLRDMILYKDEHFFSAFPSIALLENNYLLLMFRRARDSRWLLNTENDIDPIKTKKQGIHVDSRSQITKIVLNSNLQPLSKPETLSIDPQAADQDASLLVLANKNILLSSFSWYPIHSNIAQALQKEGYKLYGHPDITGCFYVLWGSFTRLSHDMGKTWSEHQYLPALPNTNDIIAGKRQNLGGAATGQPVEIDNEILLPVYCTLKNDKTSSSHIYASNDGGESWQYRSIIARDQQQNLDLNEPALVHLDGDKVMAFLRNTRGNDHIITTISHDRGHTWEDWQERNIIGHPTHPLKLADGRIFICYGYRHEPFGIRGHLMDSASQQFIGEEIIIRDDGFCGDLGYPWSVQLADGNILVVYYFTKEDGIRHISGTLLALE